MSQMNHDAFAQRGKIGELGFNEIDEVSGGIVPLAAVGAVAATTFLLGVVDGVFTGIKEDEARKANNQKSGS